MSPDLCFEGPSGFTSEGHLFVLHTCIEGPHSNVSKLIYPFIYFQPFIHLFADYFFQPRALDNREVNFLDTSLSQKSFLIFNDRVTVLQISIL